MAAPMTLLKKKYFTTTDVSGYNLRVSRFIFFMANKCEKLRKLLYKFVDNFAVRTHIVAR